MRYIYLISINGYRETINLVYHTHLIDVDMHDVQQTLYICLPAYMPICLYVCGGYCGVPYCALFKLTAQYLHIRIEHLNHIFI